MQMQSLPLAVCLLVSLLPVFVLADNVALNLADDLRDGRLDTCSSAKLADFNLAEVFNVTHIRVYTNYTQTVRVIQACAAQPVWSSSYQYVDFFCTKLFKKNRIIIRGLGSSTCEIEVGTCPVDSSGKRYYGTACTTPCSDSCLKGLCGSNTGTCTSCPADRTGPHCDEASACPDDFYGSGCSSPCPPNCPRTAAGRVCDVTNGNCIQPCPVGKQGSRCDQVRGGQDTDICFVVSGDPVPPTNATRQCARQGGRFFNSSHWLESDLLGNRSMQAASFATRNNITTWIAMSKRNGCINTPPYQNVDCEALGLHRFVCFFSNRSAAADGRCEQQETSTQDGGQVSSNSSTSTPSFRTTTGQDFNTGLGVGLGVGLGTLLLVVLALLAAFCYRRRLQERSVGKTGEAHQLEERHVYERVDEEIGGAVQPALPHPDASAKEENVYEKVEEFDDQPRVAVPPGNGSSQYEGLNSATASPSAPYEQLRGTETTGVASPGVYENRPDVTAGDAGTSSDYVNRSYQNLDS